MDSLRNGEMTVQRNHQHDYQHSHLDLTALTPKMDDVDDYYIRKHHEPGPRGPSKLSDEAPPRQRPRRVQRAMSQDHVLSPPRTPRRSGGGGGGGGGGGLLSAERLHSQEPLLLLSPARRRNKFREKALMARALSHADMLMLPPTTPVVDRHAKMTKMHSHPVAHDYNKLTVSHDYNTLTVSGGGAAGTRGRRRPSGRRSRRGARTPWTTCSTPPLPAHHNYRTASKNEVTV
ncbi:hypothetical protein CRUP_007169 [Coryphaenoides rupestris]|nr:hypothetical protein CRUP_007169 [Coryphaenoides rupestris]